MEISAQVADGTRSRVSKNSKKPHLRLVKRGKKSKTKERGLSLAKRQNLIVDYRIKARKLGRSILRKWHARLDLQELDSIVDLSLCEAAKHFNPNKGAGFLTFMFYHLRGNLIRAVTTAATENAVPMTYFGSYEAGQEEGAESGRNVYGSFKNGNAMEIAEALLGEDEMLPDEALYRKEIVELSQTACTKLDELEKEIIQRLFVQDQQIRQIAKNLGYSRCHISRVKKKALDILQSQLGSKLGTHSDLVELGLRKRNSHAPKKLRKSKQRKVEQLDLDAIAA